MEKTVILTIASASWCERAALELAATIRGNPCYTIGDMRAEVEQGGASLFSITAEGGEHVAYVVLRLEQYQGGAEGVIVAGAGRLAGADLYGQVVPALERIFRGVNTYRIESCRRGAARTLLELGYQPTHVQWRKAAPRRSLARDDRLEALAACYQEAQHGEGRHGTGGPDLRGRPGKPHGGGGSSKSLTANTDKRLVVDGNSLGISADASTVTVNTLDAGAIDKAFEFAKVSDQETGKTLNTVLGLAAGVFDKAAGAVDSSSRVVAAAYDNAQGDGTQKNILVAAGLAAVAIVAIKVLGK